jgi:hypothetical protein
MSLFDTLRYPITDIYQPSQLEQIPTDLLNVWIKKCMLDAGYTKIPAFIAKPSDSIIRMCIRKKASVLNGGVMTTEIYQQMIKESYTTLLQRMIYEYDL